MGSNFIHHLFATVPDVRITNLDALTYAGNLENLSGVPKNRYTFVHGNLCDTKLLVRLMRRADFVVNFAAETHVDRSIHGDRDIFMQTNILGVHSLLEACMQAQNVVCIVHISTDEVWGDVPLQATKRLTEESPFRPNSPYAASKAAGDMLIRSYVKTYGLPICVTHATNNFGPRQFPEKMIPHFIQCALNDRSLPLYGDGHNRRDWLYVDDHSRAIACVLSRGHVGEVYAVSAEGEEYTNLAMAKRILKALKKPMSLITHVADRPAHDRRYAVSSKKLRALGWRPEVGCGEGLTKTIEWYLDNPSWLAGGTVTLSSIRSRRSV